MYRDCSRLDGGKRGWKQVVDNLPTVIRLSFLIMFVVFPLDLKS